MKREKLKKNLCMLLILITGMNLKVVAQEVSVGADLVSSYIWRGQQLGSVSIQPNLGIAYKWFSFGA